MNSVSISLAAFLYLYTFLSLIDLKEIIKWENETFTQFSNLKFGGFTEQKHVK